MPLKKEATPKSPKTTAGRVRSARSDALLTRMQSTIETTFGLPVGSVKLVGPRKSVKKLHEESTVGDLRTLWTPQ